MEEIHFSDPKRIFNTEVRPYFSHSWYQQIINYIIHPIDLEKLINYQQNMAQYSLGRLLESRIMKNDIHLYLKQVATRLGKVISISCSYEILQTIFELLFQIFSRDALEHIGIYESIRRNCTYISGHEKTKLLGYLRLM